MNGVSLRYSWHSLGPDYARAIAGLLFTAGPVALVPAAPVVVALLGIMAALFAVFALRTALRHATAFVISESGITSEGPLGRDISWAGIRGMKLAYYTTRRDRTKGWMHLRIRGDHGSLTIDSGIDRFPEIVRMAYGAARRRGVRLNETTMANVAAMGIVVEGVVEDWGEATNP